MKMTFPMSCIADPPSCVFLKPWRKILELISTLFASGRNSEIGVLQAVVAKFLWLMVFVFYSLRALRFNLGPLWLGDNQNPKPLQLEDTCLICCVLMPPNE